jgi:hypothetical protein
VSPGFTTYFARKYLSASIAMATGLRANETKQKELFFFAFGFLLQCIRGDPFDPGFLVM